MRSSKFSSLSPNSTDSSPPSDSFLRRPATIALLLFLALAVCGFQWWRHAQNAPVRAHIEAGISYLEQGQGAAAEQEWIKAVQIDPKNSEGWELLGTYCTQAERWPEARIAWNQLLKLGQSTPQVHHQLAVCNAHLEDFEAARHHAQEVLKQDKNHVGALDVLTKLLTGEAEIEQRIKHLQHLVELQPQNLDYMSRLAEALMENQQHARARPLLDKLLALKPDLGPAYSMRGATILYTDPSPQGLVRAEADIKKALKQNPQDMVALLYLGRVYIHMKKPKEAIVYLERLGGLATAPKTHLFELSRAYRLLGNQQKSLEMRRRYAALEQQEVQAERLGVRISKNPQDYDSMLKLGLLLLQTSKPVGAERHINNAAKMRPADPRSKKALQQLEAVYVQELSTGLNALRRRDYVKVGRHLGRAMMLRPYDNRTSKAIQQFRAVSIGALPSNMGQANMGQALNNPKSQ